MTASIVIVVAAFLCLMFLVYLMKSHALTARMEPDEYQLRNVDVEAFRNLIDPREEEYLRRSLSPGDFRKVQRERLRAAIEYVSTAAENAAFMLRMGEAARRSPDPATAVVAEKLVDQAIRLRLYAFRALPRLYIATLLPGMSLPTLRLAETYEQMTRQVILLGLRSRTGGVSAA